MMENKAQNSIKKIKEDIKALLAEASNAEELIGLLSMLLTEGEKVFREAIIDGTEKFQRKKEGK